MNKLFVVVTTFDYESFRTFEGVFSTKGNAESFIKNQKIVSDDTEILEVDIDPTKRDQF